jgi:DNA-binding transcriptional LysR family regulator
MHRDELSDLMAFLAVAEVRSFTRAAARLGLSQPSLSQIIRKLEGRLGVRLLTRTTRIVALTTAGEELAATLAPAFARIEAGLTAVGDMRAVSSGSIRLTAGWHAATTVLWPALARLALAYPEVKVEVAVDSALTDIVGQKFDAGVRLGEQVARDMIAVRIGPDLRMLVVGAPEYVAAHGVPETPRELTRHRCINIRQQSAGGLYAWEFEKAGQAMSVRVDGPFVFNDVGLTIKAALAGLGLAMVFEDQILAPVAEGRLVRVLEDWCPPFAGYHLYYPDRRHPSAAFSALLGALRYRAPWPSCGTDKRV